MNKKVVSMLLGVIMLLNIITTPLSAMEGDLQDIDGLSPGYSIEYSAQTNWGNSQTAQIKITNTGTEDIEGWSLNFEADGEISGLWGATVKTHEENIYILEASPYSAVIKPNTCTTIGYTYVSENSDKPRNMVLLSERVPVSGEYEVKIDKVGGWDKEATLQLVISNKSEYPIRLWDISFNASFNILEVWGGKLIESDTESGNYKIKYSDNTQTIQPNSSVAVGMRCNNVTEPIISNIELTEINNDLNRDIDKDGVTDRDEATFGTDPLKPDTDGDGLSDFEELYITYTEPTKADTDDIGITDDKKDLDEDGLTNLQEIKLKTNPILDDTDFDDLKDGEETNKYKTDPLKFDTDGDKIGDGDEIAIGLDPLNASTHGKPDNEYTFERTIDGEAVSNVNNDSYNLSIDIKAAGNAESSMIVDKSGYTNVISNDAIVGTVPEIIYDENLSVDSFKINFNINSELVYDGNDDTYSSDEFKGIKKYNVFRYFEDMNMLLPIETTHNEETNTISAETDRTGVYCLIDMVKWVKMLGYDPAVTAETTIEEIPQIQMFSDVPGSSDISDDETDRYSCAKALPEDFFAGEFDNIEPQTNGLRARAAVNKDVLDVVFVVYPHTGTACNVMSKQILRMAFAIFNESSNARIYIINPKGDFISAPNGSCYATNYTQVAAMTKGIYFTVNRQCLDDAYKNILYSGQLRSESSKYCFNIDYERAYFVTTDDFAKKLPSALRSANINTSIISAETEKDSLYYNMAHTSGGLLMYQPGNFVDQALSHIYGYVPVSNITYNAILATGFKEIALGAPLADCPIDTDGDGLRDWDEADTQSQLIKFNVDGTVELPTYQQCIDKKGAELFYVEQGLARYKEGLIYNASGIDGIEAKGLLDNTYILPIKSDPTSTDGDGDGYFDYDEIHVYKTNPLKKSKPIIDTYFFDENGILTDESNYYDKLEWTISDKDFIDVTTITEDQFIEKLKPKNIDSDNARLLYNKCINFVHDPYTIYSESSNQYGKEYKNLLCEWMNENGYSKRVGINPEILLSTWKWESGYGSYNCFGIRSGTNNSFDRQIDTCIVNYLNKYYFALYIKNVENKELISYYNDKNSGAWFNPCNAAMYSRCKYNTDTFIEWKRWHDTIANKKW